MRTRYLLCYDVRDEARLRRAGKVAQQFGNRLQYSIFVCDLSAVERARFEQRLRKVLDLAVDCAVLVDLGQPGKASTQRLHWIAGHVHLHDSSEATIV